MPRRSLKLSPTLLQFRRDQGQRLRDLRHDSGYSLASVEHLTGVNKSTLGYAERGQQFIRMPELLTLAAFYDVSTQYIIEGGTLRRKLKTPLETVAAQVAEHH